MELVQCTKCKRIVQSDYIVRETVDEDNTIHRDICELCSDQIDTKRLLSIHDLDEYHRLYSSKKITTVTTHCKFCIAENCSKRLRVHRKFAVNNFENTFSCFVR